MKKDFLIRRGGNFLPVIFAAIAVICACMLAGGGARAEESAPDASAQPQPLAEALPWLELNPDTVGWLRVGDIIDTPVVQRDNAFYLDHDYYGQEYSGGTVFIDEECSILPRDDHLVFYGHNMKNGTVFGELDRFRDLSYLRKYPIVTFDTIYGEGKYVIFAVYDMSAETEDPHFMQMLHFNFVDNEDLWNFLYEVRKRNFYEFPIDVEYGDELMSLITCSYTLYDGRMILMCRKLRADEDPQQIAVLMQSTTLR